MKAYHRTIEAVNADILPIPYKLWEYGCQQYGSPKQISDENQYLYSLLTPVKASYNKRGITYNNLFYSSDDPNLLSKMYNTGQKKVTLESARIDVRDIGTLYYINYQGKLAHADLNLNFDRHRKQDVAKPPNRQTHWYHHSRK